MSENRLSASDIVKLRRIGNEFNVRPILTRDQWDFVAERLTALLDRMEALESSDCKVSPSHRERASSFYFKVIPSFPSDHPKVRAFLDAVIGMINMDVLEDQLARQFAEVEREATLREKERVRKLIG